VGALMLGNLMAQKIRLRRVRRQGFSAMATPELVESASLSNQLLITGATPEARVSGPRRVKQMRAIEINDEWADPVRRPKSPAAEKEEANAASPATPAPTNVNPKRAGIRGKWPHRSRGNDKRKNSANEEEQEKKDGS
jgi:hypothetical protein